MQPSMDIDGELVACKILSGLEGGCIELGKEHDVQIDLGYGESYAAVLQSGFRFNLNVGGRVIGHGHVL